MAKGLNAPPTSSMGRLFDAVASIAGLRQDVNYEGQAAIELEALASASEDGYYDFVIGPEIGTSLVIQAVVEDLLTGAPLPVISGRFHNGLARMIRDMCVWIRESSGVQEVALSGGVFQNVTLLRKALPLLREAGFSVLTHRIVPPNDGGLALGQAVIAGTLHNANR